MAATTALAVQPVAQAGTTVDTGSDSTGNVDTSNDEFPEPTISISDTAVVGRPITFGASDVSLPGQELTYRWDVAGGDERVTGTGQSFEYQFQHPGMSSVNLTVSDELGNVTFADKQFTVLNSAAQPVANMTVLPRDNPVLVGTELTLDASESAGVTDLSYEWWMYSDNQPARGLTAIGTSKTVQYTPPAAGEYDFIVIVTDAAGATSLDSRTVSAVDTVDTDDSGPAIRLSLEPSTMSVAPGSTIVFDASASTGDEITYEWAIGIDTLSTDPVWSHTFAERGQTTILLKITDKSGRSAMERLTIGVGEPGGQPLAFLDFTPSSPVSAGTKVRFNASASIGDELTYEWEVDGVEVADSVGPIFEHTFNESGQHSVEVKVVNGRGQSDYVRIDDIEVVGPDTPSNAVLTQAPPPLTSAVDGSSLDGQVASPTANRPPVAVMRTSYPEGPLTRGTPFTLDASDSTDPDGDELTYQWVIDEGAETVTSAEKKWVHKFWQPGRYRITLIVKDPSGATDRTGAYVDVTGENKPPTAESRMFPKPPAVITTGMTAIFDGGRSHDNFIPKEPLDPNDPDEMVANPDAPLTYEWRIGAGSDLVKVGASEVQKYKFDQPGNYRVALWVMDEVGAVDIDEITVSVRDPSPEAAFTQSPKSPVVLGTNVRFDASGSADPLGQPLTYEWRIEGQTDVAGNSATLDHTFTKAGTFDVQLTVATPDGTQATKTMPVTVNTPPTATYTRSPAASTLTVDTTVTFDASGSSDADGDSLTYQWTVSGDDTVGDGKIFKRAFTTPGTFGVELTVTDARGAPSKYYDTITIVTSLEPPVARYTQDPKSPVAPDTTVTFDGSGSTGEGLTYEWRVRGESGVVSTKKILEYKFEKAGLYGVELRIEDTSGRGDKYWTEVRVAQPTDPASPAPNARYTQDPKSPVAPDTTVTFDGSSSTGEGLTYEWRVRGESGVVSTKKILEYKFEKAGLYGVELRIQDTSGRGDKYWSEIRVADPTDTPNRAPTARFSQTPDAPIVAAGTEVVFDGSASSDPDGDPLTYRWYVRGESGVVSTKKILNYTFKNSGSYGIELRVTDPSGAAGKQWVALEVTK